MVAQRQATVQRHGDAFGHEQLALEPVRPFPALTHADAAAGAHHPVPGHGGLEIGKATQGPAHLAGGPEMTGQLGHAPIGEQPAPGNQGRYRVEQLGCPARLPPMPLLPRRFHRLKSVLDQRMGDLTVVLEHVKKPHNLSAILRSCDAVGVLEAHVVSLQGRPPTFNNTAQGSQKWVALRDHADPGSALASLRREGFRLYGTHLGRESVDYRHCDFTGPTAFLLGAEKWGLSEDAAQLVDQQLFIPMQGMVQSLNVSVAAAILLFEALRQRELAGVAPSRGEGLTPERYGVVLFEWAYPEVAAWCREQGRAYPPLSEDGEIEGELPRQR